jgi:hypothetical protein
MLINAEKCLDVRAHNLQVLSSNPAPATKIKQGLTDKFFRPFCFARMSMYLPSRYFSASGICSA